MTSTGTNEATFESLWEEFQSKVKLFNSKQRRQILQNATIALKQVINSMPAPRPEQDEAPISAQTKQMLIDIESLIYDRMHQLKLTPTTLFSRYSTSPGFMSDAQFRGAIASLGILLNEEELNALVQKYDSQRNGTINCNDVALYLQVASETPRTTQQTTYSNSILQRSQQSTNDYAEMQKQTSNTHAAAPAPVVANPSDDPNDARIRSGLQTMRQVMYSKSSNFHSCYLSLHNKHTTKTSSVSVNDVVQALPKLGFPSGVASFDEMQAYVSKFARQTPGELHYGEFLAFVTGNQQQANGSTNGASGDASHSSTPSALDSPSLLNALLKINNQSTRKLFKDLDADNDGLLSVGELCQGLVDVGGLHASVAKDPVLTTYIETFCQRKAGFLAYAEFIKFVTTRISSQSNGGGAGSANGNGSINDMTSMTTTKISEDCVTPSQLIEFITKTLRNSNINVDLMLNTFDANHDGKLEEEEFFQAVGSLGFIITQQQSKTLFDAVTSTTNDQSLISISEFSALLSNPRGLKLSTRVKHAPGGSSSVFSTNDDQPTPRQTGQARVQQRASGFDVYAQQTPLTPAEEQTQLSERKGMSTAHSGQGASSLNLAHSENPQSQQRTFHPSFSAGGKSSIAFGSNNMPEAPTNTVTSQNTRQSDASMLQFDPTRPLDLPKLRINPSGASSIEFSDEAPPTSSTSTPLRSPISAVSFNQNDSETIRASRRQVSGTPSSSTTIKLSFDQPQLSPEPVEPNYRPHDGDASLLQFDPTQQSETPRRKRAAGGSQQFGSSTLSLAHATGSEDLPSPSTGRKHVESAQPSTLSFVSETSATQFRSGDANAGVDIDPVLMQQLSSAIYAHSQRLRNTFTEWNHNSSAPTLSKANFLTGARALKVDLTDVQADSLFAKFDADGDQSITYSEFVRMLASK